MWLKFVVCGVKLNPKGSKAAHVFLNFDVNDCKYSISSQSLAAFCLPLGAEAQTPKERMSHEEYTFTLTQGDGNRVQGFCRRFLPPAPRVGSKLRFAQVLCLVCEVAWSAFLFKVLEVTEHLLRQSDLLQLEHAELPASSYAGLFLNSLGEQLAQQPALGSVIRHGATSSPSRIVEHQPTKKDRPWRRRAAGVSNYSRIGTDDFVELQVPPDCGNGVSNAGISLAKLLWHVPVPAMLTLIASLLRERRVLVVGQSRDIVSAAVSAAAALIYPFKWHHIYLPLLPRSLKDYLTAPMPFLIGMPAQLLPALKGIPMDEITLIDLDLGKCEPSPGSPHDDALLLPWRSQLERALHAACAVLRSPTEHESNPLITNIMQGYFLKLLGTYRSFMYADGLSPTPAALQSPGSSSNASMPPRSPSAHLGRRSSNVGSTGSLVALNEAAIGAAAASVCRPHSAGAIGMARSSNGVPQRDESLSGHGCWFDHAGLVASHRHNERARVFLGLLRQSQMYEVFVQERLALMGSTTGGPERSGDPFEQLVSSYLDNRRDRISAHLTAGARSGMSRFTAFVKKHRRTESAQPAPGGHGGGGGGGFSLDGFSESPEAARLQLLASTFAAVAAGAGQIRRNIAEGGNL
eukprot:gene11069-11225_t